MHVCTTYCIGHYIHTVLHTYLPTTRRLPAYLLVYLAVSCLPLCLPAMQHNLSLLQGLESLNLATPLCNHSPFQSTKTPTIPAESPVSKVAKRSTTTKPKYTYSDDRFPV